MQKRRNIVGDVVALTADMNKSISSRMTQFYVLIMFGWITFNLLICSVVRVESVIIRYFAMLLGILFAFVLIGYFSKKERLMTNVLNVGVLIITPISWYVCGGTTSSAVNSMYILSIVYFGLCSYGKRRLIGTIVSIMEVGGVTAVTKRFPELAMPYYAPGDSILTLNSSIGFSTTIIIVCLLFKQIREYRLENEKSEAYKKELEKSNELQKMFLANMSHEIRSPLGIVLGFNDLISQSTNLEEIREYSHNITTAGDTLKVVINDILDYSKIESGKLDIIERDYSLHSLLDDVCKNIQLKASEKGLSFSMNRAENVPDMLYGDDVRIKQCLVNVLSNAVKYTERGQVVLSVETDREESNDNECRIRFVCHDTGRGIPEEAVPYLFNAFERIDESRSRGIEGTGLGLAITKSLLDEMDGEITVDSKVNVGSDFRISLLQKVSDKKSVYHVDSSEASLAGMKIGVVDDTKANLILCRKLLQLKGAEVETFSSGREFVDVCENQKFDVLLIDHMMPEMDGVKVRKAIFEGGGMNADTPCIVFTANAMAGAEKEYLEMGFDGFVSKPINVDVLVAKIRKATDRKS